MSEPYDGWTDPGWRDLANELLAEEPEGPRPHYEVAVPGCDCGGCFGEPLVSETPIPPELCGIEGCARLTDHEGSTHSWEAK